METVKLYYGYNSSAPFDAVILGLKPGAGGTAHILLDKTVFYPEGGGQPADRGTINGVPLLDVQEKDGEILHTVSADGAGKLKTGPAVLVLDSARRRDLMAQHTGQHLLSGIILRMTGMPTVSMHIGGGTCTIDLDTPDSLSGEPPSCVLLDGETPAGLEEAVADAIEENRPVTVHCCPPEDAFSFPLRKPPPRSGEVIRVVEIEGYDFSPCCGTHLKSTAEIGMLRILDAVKYKGLTRVSFIAGRRVLRDSRLLRQNAGTVSRALSVPLDGIGQGVLDFAAKASAAEKRLKALEEEAARVKAGVLADKAALLQKAAPPGGAAGSSGPVVLAESYASAGIGEVLGIGRAAQRQTGAVLVLASEPDLKFAAFCTTKGFDLRPLIMEAFSAQGGRGGGGPSFFQGTFGTREALDAFIRALKNPGLPSGDAAGCA